LKAIRNVWDELPIGPTAYSLEWFKDMPIEEVEEGIRSAVKMVSASILSIGIALCYIERAGFMAAGFREWSEYLEAAEDRISLPKQTVSDYRRIGDTYLRYRSWLQEIGYTESCGLHKLRYLDRLFESHRKPTIKKSLLDMSFRQMRALLADSHGKLKVTEHDRETYYQKVEKQIDKVLEEGHIPYLVGVYDRGEMNVIHRALKIHRSK
jgi:hypothetical protein